MCRRVQCSKCHKPTYAGCGMHVEQVLAGVPPEDRCQCRETAKASPEAGAESSTEAGKASFLRRLFGG